MNVERLESALYNLEVNFPKIGQPAIELAIEQIKEVIRDWYKEN